MDIFRYIIIYDGMDVGKNSTKTYVQYKYEILGRKNNFAGSGREMCLTGD